MRETEEKQRRAREGREKAEAEKAARSARKRAIVDMNAHETQEGVMDSLMEALQTGAAFSRPDQRRKRQARVAGGKLYWSNNGSLRSARKSIINENALLLSSTLHEFILHKPNDHSRISSSRNYSYINEICNCVKPLEKFDFPNQFHTLVEPKQKIFNKRKKRNYLVRRTRVIRKLRQRQRRLDLHISKTAPDSLHNKFFAAFHGLENYYESQSKSMKSVTVNNSLKRRRPMVEIDQVSLINDDKNVDKKLEYHVFNQNH